VYVGAPYAFNKTIITYQKKTIGTISNILLSHTFALLAPWNHIGLVTICFVTTEHITNNLG
jgi:hypothetical protein